MKYSHEWPFGIRYDAESQTSTIFNRRHEGICRLVGRWPRVNYASAVPCERLPRLYGAGSTYLHRDDVNSARADPCVRQRLKTLLNKIPALRDEVQRRQDEKAKPTLQRSHADLISLTFNASAN